MRPTSFGLFFLAVAVCLCAAQQSDPKKGEGAQDQSGILSKSNDGENDNKKAENENEKTEDEKREQVEEKEIPGDQEKSPKTTEIPGQPELSKNDGDKTDVDKKQVPEIKIGSPDTASTAKPANDRKQEIEKDEKAGTIQKQEGGSETPKKHENVPDPDTILDMKPETIDEKKTESHPSQPPETDKLTLANPDHDEHTKKTPKEHDKTKDEEKVKAEGKAIPGDQVKSRTAERPSQPELGQNDGDKTDAHQKQAPDQHGGSTSTIRPDGNHKEEIEKDEKFGPMVKQEDKIPDPAVSHDKKPENIETKEPDSHATQEPKIDNLGIPATPDLDERNTKPQTKNEKTKEDNEKVEGKQIPGDHDKSPIARSSGEPTSAQNDGHKTDAHQKQAPEEHSGSPSTSSPDKNHKEELEKDEKFEPMVKGGDTEPPTEHDKIPDPAVSHDKNPENIETKKPESHPTQEPKIDNLGIPATPDLDEHNKKPQTRNEKTKEEDNENEQVEGKEIPGDHDKSPIARGSGEPKSAKNDGHKTDAHQKQAPEEHSGSPSTSSPDDKHKEEIEKDEKLEPMVKGGETEPPTEDDKIPDPAVSHDKKPENVETKKPDSHPTQEPKIDNLGIPATPDLDERNKKPQTRNEKTKEEDNEKVEGKQIPGDHDKSPIARSSGEPTSAQNDGHKTDAHQKQAPEEHSGSPSTSSPDDKHKEEIEKDEKFEPMVKGGETEPPTEDDKIPDPAVSHDKKPENVETKKPDSKPTQEPKIDNLGIPATPDLDERNKKPQTRNEKTKEEDNEKVEGKQIPGDHDKSPIARSSGEPTSAQNDGHKTDAHQKQAPEEHSGSPGTSSPDDKHKEEIEKDEQFEPMVKGGETEPPTEHDKIPDPAVSHDKKPENVETKKPDSHPTQEPKIDNLGIPATPDLDERNKKPQTRNEKTKEEDNEKVEGKQIPGDHDKSPIARSSGEPKSEQNDGHKTDAHQKQAPEEHSGSPSTSSPDDKHKEEIDKDEKLEPMVKGGDTEPPTEHDKIPDPAVSHDKKPENVETKKPDSHPTQELKIDNLGIPATPDLDERNKKPQTRNEKTKEEDNEKVEGKQIPGDHDKSPIARSSGEPKSEQNDGHKTDAHQKQAPEQHSGSPSTSNPDDKHKEEIDKDEKLEPMVKGGDTEPPTEHDKIPDPAGSHDKKPENVETKKPDSHPTQEPKIDNLGIPATPDLDERNKKPQTRNEKTKEEDNEKVEGKQIPGDHDKSPIARSSGEPKSEQNDGHKTDAHQKQAPEEHSGSPSTSSPDDKHKEEIEKDEKFEPMVKGGETEPPTEDDKIPDPAVSHDKKPENIETKKPESRPAQEPKVENLGILAKPDLDKHNNPQNENEKKKDEDKVKVESTEIPGDHDMSPISKSSGQPESERNDGHKTDGNQKQVPDQHSGSPSTSSPDHKQGIKKDEKVEPMKKQGGEAESPPEHDKIPDPAASHDAKTGNIESNKPKSHPAEVTEKGKTDHPTNHDDKPNKKEDQGKGDGMSKPHNIIQNPDIPKHSTPEEKSNDRSHSHPSELPGKDGVGGMPDGRKQTRESDHPNDNKQGDKKDGKVESKEQEKGGEASSHPDLPATESSSNPVTGGNDKTDADKLPKVSGKDKDNESPGNTRDIEKTHHPEDDKQEKDKDKKEGEEIKVPDNKSETSGIKDTLRVSNAPGSSESHVKDDDGANRHIIKVPGDGRPLDQTGEPTKTDTPKHHDQNGDDGTKNKEKTVTGKGDGKEMIKKDDDEEIPTGQKSPDDKVGLTADTILAPSNPNEDKKDDKKEQEQPAAGTPTLFPKFDPATGIIDTKEEKENNPKPPPKHQGHSPKDAQQPETQDDFISYIEMLNIVNQDKLLDIVHKILDRWMGKEDEKPDHTHHDDKKPEYGKPSDHKQPQEQRPDSHQNHAPGGPPTNSFPQNSPSLPSYPPPDSYSNYGPNQNCPPGGPPPNSFPQNGPTQNQGFPSYPPPDSSSNYGPNQNCPPGGPPPNSFPQTGPTQNQGFPSYPPPDSHSNYGPNQNCPPGGPPPNSFPQNGPTQNQGFPSYPPPDSHSNYGPNQNCPPGDNNKPISPPPYYKPYSEPQSDYRVPMYGPVSQGPPSSNLGPQYPQKHPECLDDYRPLSYKPTPNQYTYPVRFNPPSQDQHSYYQNSEPSKDCGPPLYRPPAPQQTPQTLLGSHEVEKCNENSPFGRPTHYQEPNYGHPPQHQTGLIPPSTAPAPYRGPTPRPAVNPNPDCQPTYNPHGPSNPQPLTYQGYGGHSHPPSVDHHPPQHPTPHPSPYNPNPHPEHCSPTAPPSTTTPPCPPTPTPPTHYYPAHAPPSPPPCPPTPPPCPLTPPPSTHHYPTHAPPPLPCPPTPPPCPPTPPPPSTHYYPTHAPTPPPCPPTSPPCPPTPPQCPPPPPPPTSPPPCPPPPCLPTPPPCPPTPQPSPEPPQQYYPPPPPNNNYCPPSSPTQAPPAHPQSPSSAECVYHHHHIIENDPKTSPYEYQGSSGLSYRSSETPDAYSRSSDERASFVTHVHKILSKSDNPSLNSFPPDLAAQLIQNYYSSSKNSLKCSDAEPETCYVPVICSSHRKSQPLTVQKLLKLPNIEEGLVPPQNLYKSKQDSDYLVVRQPSESRPEHYPANHDCSSDDDSKGAELCIKIRKKVVHPRDKHYENSNQHNCGTLSPPPPSPPPFYHNQHLPCLPPPSLPAFYSC